MLVSPAPAALRFSAERLARRERDAERELRQLRHALDLHSVFLEIGAGDCTLARRAAGYVERAYAEKYATPGSLKYVRGFHTRRRRDTTIEFIRA